MRRLPLASASVTVTLEVVEPSATTLVGAATNVVFPLVGSGKSSLLKSAAVGKLKSESPGGFHRKRSLCPPPFS